MFRVTKQGDLLVLGTACGSQRGLEEDDAVEYQVSPSPSLRQLMSGLDKKMNTIIICTVSCSKYLGQFLRMHLFLRTVRR